MGGVARVLVVAIVCAGCGSFAEAKGDPAANVSDSTPSAGEDRQSAPPAETNAAPIELPKGSAAPADLVVFRDDFGRPTGDLLGPWTTEKGHLEIVAPPDAGRRLVAISDDLFPSSQLVKRLDGVAGNMKVSARARLAIEGAFQSSDYCDVLAIWLKGDVLASFYVNGNARWSSWVYAGNGIGGSGKAFPASSTTAWSDLALEVKWDAATVTVVASVDGVEQTLAPLSGLVGLVDATPSIAVGPWCFGEKLPSVSTEVDEVVVTTPPR